MKISSCKSLEVNNCTTYVYGFGSIEIASDECLDFSGLCYRLSWMSTLHPFSHAAATRKQSEVGRGRLVCTGREAPRVKGPIRARNLDTHLFHIPSLPSLLM